jgi:hypothetical protein
MLTKIKEFCKSLNWKDAIGILGGGAAMYVFFIFVTVALQKTGLLKWVTVLAVMLPLWFVSALFPGAWFSRIALGFNLIQSIFILIAIFVFSYSLNLAYTLCTFFSLVCFVFVFVYDKKRYK